MLAAIVATTTNGCNTSTSVITPLSLGVGSKCLPMKDVAEGGTQVFDSHAEVLARRAFQLFVMQEIAHSVTAQDVTLAVDGGGQQAVTTSRAQQKDSIYFERTKEGKWRLCEHVKLHLYVSHAPCAFAPFRSARNSPLSRWRCLYICCSRARAKALYHPCCSCSYICLKECREESSTHLCPSGGRTLSVGQHCITYCSRF